MSAPDTTSSHISMHVNGHVVESETDNRMILVHFLRRKMGLTGTKVGCDTTSCGACTVLLDGRAIKSCTFFAVQADGRTITTIEGVGSEEELHPVQRGFWEEHGLQCGYCTPGMIMAAIGFLDKVPDPTESEIRSAIAGNLCRCTGYANIVRAIESAAKALRTPADTT
jgi:carbon-monoxide dehydrogenase small subunit